MSYQVPEFTMPCAVDWKDRLKNVEHSMSLGLPVLEEQPQREGYLSLVCYGPSLRQTYLDICKPSMSVSGAHDFMMNVGRTPTYHLESDPRPHKAQMLRVTNDETHYLIASCCHPEVFEALKGRKVSIWHVGDSEAVNDWYRANTKGLIVGGGSTAGLRALEVAHILGFRSLEIHGMDSSFDHSTQWAGPHTGKRKTEFMVKSGNRYFKTSSLMVQAAREFIHFWQTHDIKVRVKGDGLIRQMMKEAETQHRRAA